MRTNNILSLFEAAKKQTLRQRFNFKKVIGELILGNMGLRIWSERGCEGSRRGWVFGTVATGNTEAHPCRGVRGDRVEPASDSPLVEGGSRGICPSLNIFTLLLSPSVSCFLNDCIIQFYNSL